MGTFSILAATAVSLSLAVPAFAQGQPPYVEIKATTMARLTDGGCKITFEMSNAYTKTLQVVAQATLIDKDKASLISQQIYFPPAIPSGKSIKEVSFYAMFIAGGKCPDVFDIQINHSGTAQDCTIVGEKYALRDNVCYQAASYTVAG